MGRRVARGHDALSFETTVSSNWGIDLIWRHWVFATKDRSCFVVSTLDQKHLEQHATEIDAMLASFTASQAAAPACGS